MRCSITSIKVPSFTYFQKILADAKLAVSVLKEALRSVAQCYANWNRRVIVVIGRLATQRMRLTDFFVIDNGPVSMG